MGENYHISRAQQYPIRPALSVSVGRLVAAAAVFGLTACSWPEWAKLPKLPELPGLPDLSFADEGVEERPAISCDAALRLNLQAMDWAEAKTADVHIRKARFRPGTVVLTANAPNVIRLLNSDDAIRTFRAKEFFRSAAVVRVLYDGTPVPETCIDAIRIGPGKWAEIRIVPLRQGEFPFGEEAPSSNWYAGPFPSDSRLGQILVR